MTKETHKTFCRFCHAYCAIEVDVEDGRPIAVRGDTDDPVYGGYTCIKGRQLPSQYSTPKRVSKTLKRSAGGDFHVIDINDAMDEIAAKVTHLIEQYGPRSVATYVGSYGYQNSAALHLAKAWHASVGSTSYYTSVTIDQPARRIAASQFGTWDGGTHAFTGADVCMMVGNNPVVSQYTPFGGPPPFSPYARLRAEMKKGMKVIVIDPRKTEVANRATLHLQVNPAEDPTLLSAIINFIFKHDLYDHEFCSHHLQDLEQLKQLVAPFTPEYAAARCNIAADDLIAAAQIFAEANRGVAVTGTGPNMAPRAILTEHLVLCLNSICGRVNKSGERVPNPGLLQPSRPRRAEVLEAQPAFHHGPKARVRNLGQIIGEMPTATLNDEILLDGEGQIKALICLGGNPIVAFPDQDKTKKAMEKLDLLVCVDLYKSATAKLADYIIAPTLSLERDDITMLTDTWYDQPYSHYTRAILPKNEQSREEWEIYWELSKRSGIPLELPGGQLSVEHRPSKFEVLEMLTPGSKVPLKEIADQGKGAIFEAVQVTVEPGRQDQGALLQLMPAGISEQLADVATETYWQSGKITDAGTEYTHLLISRRLKHVFNSSGQQLEPLQKKGTTNPAYMNPEDLGSLGIQSGDLIEVQAAAGSLVGVVESAKDVKPGVISMAHAWGDIPDNFGDVRSKGASTNRLVDDDRTFDKISGMPRMSAIPVNVRHVPEEVA
ncbi:MAG: molybdopterin-dependent oxidoreductase [Gammaproteobacteria bacterium]|jgi:anaerobic selenocysteine-containing dehydrogenase|nr:molybdopterin-dependent oxidoreductase [Gammaproteobacteria bacterium]MBT6245529.1 molybdopterin-dependent oxidoreductase [Gammaproteobacteria bacterium]